MGRVRLAYWLVPEVSARSSIEKIIKILAKSFDGPVFTPHLTLPAHAIKKFDSKLKLRCLKLDFSDEFKRTCFVTLESHKNLNLSLPHLSLFYGKLSKQQRKTIATNLSFAPNIIFNELWMVEIGDEIKSSRDVEHWRVVKRIMLKS
jgi:hypothetical protein